MGTTDHIDCTGKVFQIGEYDTKKLSHVIQCDDEEPMTVDIENAQLAYELSQTDEKEREADVL